MPLKRRTDLKDDELFRALMPAIHAYMHNVYNGGSGVSCEWHENLSQVHSFGTGLLSGLRFVFEYPKSAQALYMGLFTSALAKEQLPVAPTDVFAGTVSMLLDSEPTPQEGFEQLQRLKDGFSREPGLPPMRPGFKDGKLVWLDEPIEQAMPEWENEL